MTNKAIKLLKVAESVLSPDPREGLFNTSKDNVIFCLTNLLSQKYSLHVAFRSNADRIHSSAWRDSLFEHFEDHAEEELDMAYDIAMKIVSLGSDPVVSNIEIPYCAADVSSVFNMLIEMELKAIDTANRLAKMSGNNTSLRVLAENIVLIDTQHIDDIRRMGNFKHDVHQSGDDLIELW